MKPVMVAQTVHEPDWVLVQDAGGEAEQGEQTDSSSSLLLPAEDEQPPVAPLAPLIAVEPLTGEEVATGAENEALQDAQQMQSMQQVEQMEQIDQVEQMDDETQPQDPVGTQGAGEVALEAGTGNGGQMEL